MGDGINRKLHGIYSQAERQGPVFSSPFLLFQEAEGLTHITDPSFPPPLMVRNEIFLLSFAIFFVRVCVLRYLHEFLVGFTGDNPYFHLHSSLQRLFGCCLYNRRLGMM